MANYCRRCGIEIPKEDTYCWKHKYLEGFAAVVGGVLAVSVALPCSASAYDTSYDVEGHSIYLTVNPGDSPVYVDIPQYRMYLDTELEYEYTGSSANDLHQYYTVFPNNEKSMVLGIKPSGKFEYDTVVRIDGVSYVFEPTHSYIAGDLNGDYNVTIADLYLMSGYQLGVRLPKFLNNADVDMDGEVDVYDVIELRRLVVKNK